MSILKKINKLSKNSTLSENKFFFLKTSDFYSFFRKSDSKIPQKMNRIKSYKRVNTRRIIKLVGMLSKNGKKTKIINTFILSLRSISAPGAELFWRSYLPISNKLIGSSINGPNNRLILKAMHSIFIEKPLFLFYIYKIDKKIYKNSRGKSGKYKFLWKYVPSYKRNSTMISWVAKEMRTVNGRTISSRMSRVFLKSMFYKNSMWFSKVKKFSVNYSYMNYKYTLLDNYITKKN